jgi:hypothetical protein
MDGASSFYRIFSRLHFMLVFSREQAENCDIFRNVSVSRLGGTVEMVNR